MTAAAEKVETRLQLLGSTAIKDKLQDRVPDTIVKIKEVGVKLWVFTGDKLETAHSIDWHRARGPGQRN